MAATVDLQTHEARCASAKTTDDHLAAHLRRCFAAPASAPISSSVPPPPARPSPPPHHSDPYRHPSSLLFHVKDNDLFGAELIGTAEIPLSQIAAGPIDRLWVPVISPKTGKPPKPDCALLVSLRFTPVQDNPVYRKLNGGVPNCYFEQRNGGMVKLYQDAHVREGELPEIELEKGRVFEHGTCWEDICHAILEAHHLIYLVGWSIYDKVRLVREPTRALPEAGKMTLGDLLKYKSQEGVRVCMLVWDDKTSHDKMFIKTEGVMATHDEETRKFFKHSSVICVLSPRYASNKLSIFKQRVVGTLFTHHQKCVLVDTQAYRNNRKITAFIGGLDLCDGRYDTPEHRLFSDLDTVFANDFHNPTFATETKGPRQPWHDLHCKIEGPAAYDILTNFEQRWRKATKWRELGWWFKKPSHWHDDALLKLERISWIISPKPGVPVNHPSLRVTEEGDIENWHVQVFRSIDSGSAKGEGFSKMLSDAEKHARIGKARRLARLVEEAHKRNLVCQKNLVVDKSIHTAYVKAIRSAQHFIYIENQYFLGSSYNWPDYNNSGADNLIPMELALKVASKIIAQERFAVYVVIPMWPEGVPTTNSVQEILFWQAQTIQMMYDIIGKTLESMNMRDAHPQDYLNFYCLGNREELPKDNSQPTEQPSEKSAAALAQKFRRFMIYVHAKGMIVDDEYVILGSANINQRSLAGSRDTEIAMGAYQPHQTWDEKKTHPRGQVGGLYFQVKPFYVCIPSAGIFLGG
ncbi:uncharacterized protein A4U43_C07F24320 [Asparagus officinalis]|uniref:Phospholipase D n=1 Tax=Asparagus officinalis TaxID=4686 RepID=A0A5P1EEJ0_ASPOF|nr:uncharacterized protein A4U43_C07F24320 [Asparagus officinalis]